jgi:hypothetical protein
MTNSTGTADQDSAATGGDPDLVALVQMADAFGLEQHVVLTLAGQVVSGTLTGARAYFDELATTVQGDDPEETWRGSLGARFRQKSADLADWGAGSKLGDLDPDGPDAEDLPPMPAAEYLHLRNAEVVVWPRSGQRLPLWRGRVSDVAGWTLGDFEDAPSEY